MRRLLGGALAASLLLLTAGCQGQVGADRLAESVAATFAGLYQRQQSLVGNPPVVAADLQATAVCEKGGADEPDVGPGDTWTCTVRWLVSGTDGYAQAAWHVELRPDGTYVADGEGPRVVNELHTIPAADGSPVINPLWQFDGIVDLAG